jgi:uncharacterized protein (TIGR04255 family)
MGRQLKNKPLVEALLEVKWKLTPAVPDTLRDPAYRLVVGRLYDRIRERFPVVQELPAAQIPDEMTAYVVKQQFRRESNGWPVVQLGPGVATLNHTSSYSWRVFLKDAKFVLPRLMDAYSNAGSGGAPVPPQVVSVLLRYINAVPFDWESTDALLFLRDKLHTTVSLPTQVSPGTPLAGPPTVLHLQVGYPIFRPKGQGLIRIASGRRGQEPALIWELVIHSKDEDSPQLTALGNFWTWMQDAHNVAEEWFFALIAGELDREFSGRET